MQMHILGYVTIAGQRHQRVELEDRQALLAFLEDHLFDDEVVLTDAQDQMIFRAVQGVDVYSRLDEFSVDLPAIYRRLRRAAVSAAPQIDDERADWEDAYDTIGLSPQETAMRQRAKQSAKAARTVADVVELLTGTYFDASFESEDGSRSWGYFTPRDLSVEEERPDGTTGQRIHLSPQARVRHIGSGEDLHVFVLVDAPPD